jgi:hypothetical protein
MRTLQGLVVIGVVLGLGLAFSPRPGWAACCKCTACSPPPAIQCTDAAVTVGACDDFCEGCSGSHIFQVEATCGVGAFADCFGAPEAQAPALGSVGIGVAAAALLATGVILLARRARRVG